MLIFLEQFIRLFFSQFTEAMPFFLLGIMFAGLVFVFIPPTQFQELRSRPLALSILAGLGIGFLLPVSASGVIPIFYALHRKGFPLSAGITLLLSAPLLNPIILATTYAAFGPHPIFFLRLGGGTLIAIGVGLLFSFSGAEDAFKSDSSPELYDPTLAFREGFQSALRHAGDLFFRFGAYLVIGLLLASLLQVIVPSYRLSETGQGRLASILMVQALTFIRPLESTLAAFTALPLLGVHPTGVIVAYLVSGALIDIKRFTMLSSIFKPKSLAYLTLLILASTTLFALGVG